jgi:hypothetical protein
MIKQVKGIVIFVWLCVVIGMLISSAQADPILEYGPDGAVTAIRNLEVTGKADLYNVLFCYDSAVDIWDSTISTAEFKEDKTGAQWAASAVRVALYNEVTGPRGYFSPGDYYFWIPYSIGTVPEIGGTTEYVLSYGGYRNPDEGACWVGTWGGAVPEVVTNYAKFSVVPLPGAFVLGAIGLSYAGWRLRRTSS